MSSINRVKTPRKELNEREWGYNQALELYAEIRELDIGDRSTTWDHYEQLIRAAASVAVNIAEGAGRFRGQPSRDIQRFKSFARGSVHEVAAWLEIALIDGRITEAQFNGLHDKCVELSNVLYAGAAKTRTKTVELDD